MKRITGFVAAVSMSILVAGCFGVEPVEPLDPAPEPVEPSETINQEEIQSIALEIAWGRMTEEDKVDICWGWNSMGEDWSLDNMEKGMPNLNREAATEFLDGKC